MAKRRLEPNPRSCRLERGRPRERACAALTSRSLAGHPSRASTAAGHPGVSRLAFAASVGAVRRACGDLEPGTRVWLREPLRASQSVSETFPGTGYNAWCCPRIQLLIKQHIIYKANLEIINYI